MNIKEQQAEWLLNWQEILGEGNVDVNPENSVQLDIWALEIVKQEECFSIFPNGLKMLKHAHSVRNIVRKKQPVSDEILLSYLDKINNNVASVLTKTQDQDALSWNDYKKKCAAPNIYRGNADMGRQLLRKGCSPAEPLNEIMSALFQKHFGVAGLAAHEFLSEPFYKTTHYTDIQMSIFWGALKDEYDEDPYEAVIELFKLSAQACWNENDNELYVFIETD